MNERIKELLVQATAFARENVEYSRTEGFDIFTEKLYVVSREKFAELIIDECLRMCDCAEVSLLEHSYPREADGASSVKIFIKDWFGVEE